MADKNEEALANLRSAEAQSEQTTKKCGKTRGGAGGWKIEGDYLATEGRLYQARVNAGVSLTTRKKFDGSYYIIGESSPK